MNPNEPNVHAVVYASPALEFVKPVIPAKRLVVASFVMGVGFLFAGLLSSAALYFAGVVDRTLGYAESGLVRDAAFQSFVSSLGIFAVAGLMIVAIGWLVKLMAVRTLSGDQAVKSYFWSCVATLLVPVVIVSMFNLESLVGSVTLLPAIFVVAIAGSYSIGLLVFRNTSINQKRRNTLFIVIAIIMAQVFLVAAPTAYFTYLGSVESEFNGQRTAQYEAEVRQDAQKEDAQARGLFNQQIAYMKEKNIPQLQPGYIESGYTLKHTEIVTDSTVDGYKLTYGDAEGIDTYVVELFVSSASEFGALEQCSKRECRKLGSLADGTPIFHERGTGEDGRLFIFKNNMAVMVSEVILSISPNGNHGSLGASIDVASPTYKVLSSLTEKPLVYTD